MHFWCLDGVMRDSRLSRRTDGRARLQAPASAMIDQHSQMIVNKCEPLRMWCYDNYCLF